MKCKIKELGPENSNMYSINKYWVKCLYAFIYITEGKWKFVSCHMSYNVWSIWDFPLHFILCYFFFLLFSLLSNCFVGCAMVKMTNSLFPHLFSICMKPMFYQASKFIFSAYRFVVQINWGASSQIGHFP